MDSGSPQDPESEWEFFQAMEVLGSPISEPERLQHTQTPASVSDCVRSSATTELHPSYDSDEDGSLFKLLHSDLRDWASISEQNKGNGDSSPTSETGLSVPSQRRLVVPIHQQSSQDGFSTRPPQTGRSTPQVTKPNVTGISTLSPSPAVTILKRPPRNTDNKIPADSHPKTPVNATTCTNHSKSMPIANSKLKKKPKQARQNEISESSAEAESDPSVVFDCPPSKKSKALAFVPLQVGSHDMRSGVEDTPPSSYEDVVGSSLASGKIKGDHGISLSDPIHMYSRQRDGFAQRVSLITMLLNKYDDYAQLVSQMGRPQVCSNTVESRPVHVFVDMSNILVGFHNTVKYVRKIPQHVSIRHLDISFANLSLIMERGRVAAKRVLVGSDRVPSIDEAEKLGYETNILDRVHKIKNTPSRPSKFRNPPSCKRPPLGKPEMADASAERWVEQGVDEILHLKMLESLLDTDEPATIVLATGDAAKAEYSAGFMRMVERALQRGWNVELVSFTRLTSYAYKKKEFRDQWGSHFRMVELDPYVEELLDLE
ncbi:hypothetical protein N7490_007801 [Penicillium lividum]|nr:hypothetical protein N7490_007801 [Penicillium lividum]